MTKLVVVYNTASGGGASRETLETYFRDAGLDVDAFVAIDDASFTRTIATWRDTDAIIAVVGGDGTVAAVGNKLYGHTAVLAPLPGGTLNHFTKDAGITQDLARAIKHLSHATPHPVDIARVNDRYFFNNSSIGIYPTSLSTRKRFEDRLGKWPAAIIAGIRAFVRFRLYTVTIDDTTFTSPFVFIGNNIYHLEHGGERRSVNDGTLCVYAIKSDKRRTLFKLVLASSLGLLHEQPEFIENYTRRVTIHTTASHISVSADGEVFRTTSPLTYECVPGGLTIT